MFLTYLLFIMFTSNYYNILYKNKITEFTNEIIVLKHRINELSSLENDIVNLKILLHVCEKNTIK